MDIYGVWQIEIKTPLGTQELELSLQPDLEFKEAFTGSFMEQGESRSIYQTTREGNLLRWSQKVRHPLELSLRFEVQVQDERMTGVVKAGILPQSSLLGRRIG